MIKHVLLNSDQSSCGHCLLDHLCIPRCLTVDELEQINELVKERLRIPKGIALYRAGNPVHSIYGIRSGSIKTELENSVGQMQITGFFLAGELVGLDSLSGNFTQHTSAIALEDTEVCVLKLEEMESLAHAIPSLGKHLFSLLSREICRSYQMNLSLAVMTSEQRVAAFLMHMSQKMATLGYSPNEFILRMKRADIGNYLGLTLETVSRLFSRFSKDGLISVNQKHVIIRDREALQKIIEKAN